MNKDQRLLEEAYESIHSTNEPLYFGPKSQKVVWMVWLNSFKHAANSDGSVDIFDSVSLKRKNLYVLPFKFNEVHGHFDCSHNNLESLQGAPKIVLDSFACDYNKLKTLQGAPQSVRDSFNCGNNLYLKSLEHCPQIIGGFFNCFNCKLTSFEGGPKIVRGNFHSGLNNIHSLQGAPEVIEGTFYAEHFSDKDYRKFLKGKELDKSLSKDFDVSALDDF